jgi:NAD(P)-dependent dehydrogenase (short-subunit alcohol dehydrogenase family)
MTQLPKTPSFRLDGQRALVAGASKGIGLGCAVALAEAGAHVICVARNKTELDQSVNAMIAQKLSAEALVLDITDLPAMEAAFASVGRLDVFVNSAGTARHTQAIDTQIADYDAVMALNVRSAYFASAWAARAILAGKARGQSGGAIINISSQMGHVGGIDRGVYAASKHALEGMTKSMAIEWGPHNIRINTVCPTFIRTELGEMTLKNPERRAWIMSKIKLGRVGEVEDIMGAVVFLASPAGALITGTSLLIDGGWTAG